MSDQTTTLLEDARAAIGSFLWIGNNLHQIKGSPDTFRALYEAALADARSVYDRLSALADRKANQPWDKYERRADADEE